MQNLDAVLSTFEESARTVQHSASKLAPAVSRAADLMLGCLAQGGKVLSCGNGGSAADSQHFAAELVNRFETEREGLAAVALTTDSSALTSIANDYSFNRIFARQVEAIGRGDDVLLAITTSGTSGNILEAILAAREKGMHVVLLTGRGGGQAATLLTGRDVEIRVPASATARIQEVHLVVIHSICHIIDQHLIDQEETQRR